MDHSLFKPLLAASMTASTFVVGSQVSLSHVTLAALLNPSPRISEETVLRQFRAVFWRGFQLCPVPAFFSTLCCIINIGLVIWNVGFFKLAADPGQYLLQGRVPQLLLVAVLAVGLVPYTLTYIVPVEEPLLHRAKRLQEQGGKSDTKKRNSKTAKVQEEEEDTVVLLQKWKVRNYIRAVIPALSVVVGWWVYSN